MKVLFLRTDFYGTQVDIGVSSLHRGQANAFHKENDQVVYVSCGLNPLDSRSSYYYIPYKNFFLDLPEVYNLSHINRAASKTIQIILDEKPDFFIHHHSILNYSGTLIKKKTGTPFVLHCDGIEYWAKKHWGGKLYLSWLLKWAEEIQWANADIINVPSHVIKNHMVELGVDDDKILINPNCVDPDIFNPNVESSYIRKKHNIIDKYVIGFVGSFGPWHGAEYLAESIKIVSKEIPEAFFLFVGDGILRPIIDSILKDLPRSLHHITGLVNYSEIPAYMNACDILTSPCINNDDNTEFFNSPLKLFEYMAMAKPVIATDVGQQSMVISHNSTGLLCKEKSPVELADAILKLYNDKNLAAKLGDNARREVLEKYDWRFYNKRITDKLKSVNLIR